MKNYIIGWAFIAAILFTSCGTNDHKITQTITDSTGWLQTYDSAGKQLAYNHRDPVFSYKVQPSTVQKYDLAKKNHRLFWCYFFVSLAIASIVWSVLTTINPKRGGWQSIAGGFLAIILLWCAAGSIDWAVTKESLIPKTTYDSLMKADGNLKKFWDENLYK